MSWIQRPATILDTRRRVVLLHKQRMNNKTHGYKTKALHKQHNNPDTLGKEEKVQIRKCKKVEWERAEKAICSLLTLQQ